MWPMNLTRQEYHEFLMEHADHIIDTMLDAYSYTLDSIVMDDLLDELEEYSAVAQEYSEVC